MQQNKQSRIYQSAAQIAALILANAMIFQEELSRSNPRVQKLRRTITSPDPIAALRQHWSFILSEIDYVPIFAIAHEILLDLPVSPQVTQAITRLSEAVLNIVSQRTALRHDLMGRIFHRLLLEAKYLGTYYTSVPAATLLLKLALRPEDWPDIDWGDLESIQTLRIADLACGTGTLLMAAQQAITDNWIRASSERGNRVTPELLRDLHTLLVEDVLYGYDVLASAIHLTASTLALLAPEVTFKKMHLYVLPLGGADSQPELGSLEFLDRDQLSVRLTLSGEPEGAVATEVTGMGETRIAATIPPLHLCVMNPPFTRSVGGNLLFGSLPKAKRKRMQKRLEQLLRNRLADMTAGLGSAFVIVGDKFIRTEGRMALVLPAAVTMGDAWKKTRQLFVSKYVVEYVITSHDPTRWNFSENTDLSEVLLIARKRTGSASEGTTTFVNLWKNPVSVADALAVADGIMKTKPAQIGHPDKVQYSCAPIRFGDATWGEVVSVPWTDLGANQWYPAAFAQTDLIRVGHFLRRGYVYIPGKPPIQVPVTCLSTIAAIGPDRRDVHDGFELATGETSYPAFWGHHAKEVQCLAAEPTRYLSPLCAPKSNRPLRNASMLWKRAGSIMLAERLRLTTQRVVAVHLPVKALSNVWWPLSLVTGSDAIEKAFVVWMNSTLGLITLLSCRVATEGPWVQLKKPDLSTMPVLDLAKLDTQSVQRLADVYDCLCDKSLQPFPAMRNDPIRCQLDDAIAHVLTLPPEEIGRLRELLAREPVISGKALT